jgi:hypothetical protein
MEDERRFWRKVLLGAPSECWLWQGRLNRYGYGTVLFKKARHLAHHLAWALETRESIAKGQRILWSCGNKLCCNPNHMRLSATSPARGAAKAPPNLDGHWFSKLTEDKVRQMRALSAAGWRHRCVASLFGISVDTVRGALVGRTWRHVPSPVRPKGCHHSLSEREVHRLKTLLKDGTGGLQRDLAERFSVSQSLVCLINQGKQWRHVCVE